MPRKSYPRKVRPSDILCNGPLNVNQQKIIGLLAATAPGGAVEYAQLLSILNETTSTNAVQLPVQNIAALVDLDTTKVVDKTIILVEDQGTYRYDAQSEAAESSPEVLIPTDVTEGPGRWILITPVVKTNTVTNLHLKEVATQILKGRVTGGTGPVEDLSVAQVKTLLGIKTRKYLQAIAGVKDAANLIFTLEPGIAVDTICVFQNGALKIPVTDYVVTQDENNTTITFVVAPAAIDVLVSNYEI